MSFAVACDTVEEVDRLWEILAEGGTPLMPLDSYPFSERYGWTEDRYGVSWQVSYTGGADVTQPITPTLMFVGDVCGKAEEAIAMYASVFPDSEVGWAKEQIARVTKAFLAMKKFDLAELERAYSG